MRPEVQSLEYIIPTEFAGQRLSRIMSLYFLLPTFNLFPDAPAPASPAPGPAAPYGGSVAGAGPSSSLTVCS